MKFSADDKQITQTIINALKPLNIEVVDHVLVAGTEIVSMRNTTSVFRNPIRYSIPPSEGLTLRDNKRRFSQAVQHHALNLFDRVRQSARPRLTQAQEALLTAAGTGGVYVASFSSIALLRAAQTGLLTRLSAVAREVTSTASQVDIQAAAQMIADAANLSHVLLRNPPRNSRFRYHLQGRS